jgi:uncharacterized protein YdcH (DUF465 family)
MGGLIWSGIGQGIANAGQTIGGMMMKDIEYQRQLQAEQRKEDNFIRRQEESQRIRDEAAEVKAEALQQRVIKETTAAQAAGAEVPSARMAGQLKTVQGQIAGESPAMSEAELQQLIKDNPQYKKIYEEAGYVTKKNESLERAEGAIASAMAAGASSTTIGNLQKQRTAVLDEIKQEFKEKQEVARAERFETVTGQTNERLEILAKNSATMARNAATAENRASKESNARSARETTMDLQRKVDVAQDEVAEALGVSKNEVNAKLKIMAKRAETDPNAKAELEKVQEVRDKLTAARNRLTAWEAKGGSDTAPGGGAKPAAEKAPTKSAPGGMPAPKTQADLAKLPSGTRYTAPDGSIRIKQ